MTKALSIIRLDLITVKPYLTIKNFFIFFAVALFMTISTGVSGVAIGILMVYAALYVTYPFAVGEKSNMDALYATLAIRRETVVLGRYFFALAADLVSAVVAFSFAYVALTVMQKGFNLTESLFVTVILFVVYSLIQAFQLPLFFKLGYTKAKFLSYVPFIGFPAAILLFNYLMEKIITQEQIVGFMVWIEGNRLTAAVAGVLIWLGVMALSYRLSRGFYRKRDL